jgi:hypothetical protein
MEQRRNIKEKDADELRKIFKKSVGLTKTVFGDKAFKRFISGSEHDYNGKWETTKVNRGLFDIIMYGFTRYEKNHVSPFSEIIREEMIRLLSYDDRFINAISGAGTDNREKVQIKFKTWLDTLEKIIGNNKQESRSFSYNYKKQMFDSNPKCAICNQIIQTIDDSELDHIEPYSLGGKTTEKNARLTHRYCNRQRGNK